MVEEADEEKDEIERGPRGGRKHKPGRDHDHKSKRWKTYRFRKKAEKARDRKKKEMEEEARELDQMSEEAQKLLKKPKVKPSKRGGK